MTYIINRPLFRRLFNFFSRDKKITANFISQHYSFHRMTISFPSCHQFAKYFTSTLLHLFFKYGKNDDFAKSVLTFAKLV